MLLVVLQQLLVVRDENWQIKVTNLASSNQIFKLKVKIYFSNIELGGPRIGLDLHILIPTCSKRTCAWPRIERPSTPSIAKDVTLMPSQS